MPPRAIEAIFYTRFHHEKGSRVLHQVPPGSITTPRTPSKSDLAETLFPFSSVTTYLIPSQHFCDRLLTFVVNHHRIIGYPVCIQGAKYSRNEFIFNFALVIGESEADWACYGEVVRKLGRLLRGLEEQGGFLSKEEQDIWERDDDGEARGDVGQGSKVYALCEMVLEDLNNYAECMIPIDDSNTINLKLFPTRPPPPPISAHQVPLLTISLSSLQSPISSDLTFNRVLPYINGVNSVARIAHLADTDLSLTRRAIQHLVYYGCLVLLDIFSFGAMYAPTAEISGFVVDDDLKDECARYVCVPRMRIGSTSAPTTVGTTLPRQGHFEARDSISSSTSAASHSHSRPHADDQNDPYSTTIPHMTLISLYTSLRTGLCLKNWVLAHLPLLTGIDVRRLITFGIIKGFLYRIHKYAIATSSLSSPTTASSAAATVMGTKAPPGSLATSLAVGSEVRSGNEGHGGEGGGGTLASGNGGNGGNDANGAAGADAGAGAGAGAGEEGGGTVGGGGNEAGARQRQGKNNALTMLKFLDGMHCFDEICLELGVGEGVVEQRVKALGDGTLGLVIQR
ncbi:Nitrogen permease regulator 2 [Pleosporales sp. CAS-2024a]